MAPVNSKVSNASMLERLSRNIFITNFHVQLSAKELWNTCSKYGTVLDVFIPNKVSKQGKRVAFARFNKVNDVDLLIKNLKNSSSNVPLNTSKPSYAKVVKSKEVPLNHDEPVMVLEQGTLNFEGDPVLVGSLVTGHRTLKYMIEVFGLMQKVEAEEHEVIPVSFQNHVNKDTNVERNTNEVTTRDAYEAHFAENTQEPLNEPSGDPFGLEDLILKSSKKGIKVAQEMNDSQPRFPPGSTPQTSDHSENENVKAIHESTPSPISKQATNEHTGYQDLEEFVNKSTGGSKQEHVDFMAGPTKPINGALWTYMTGIIKRWHGEVIVMRDFNEVRYASKCHGSSFHSLNAAEFNMFIANSQLIDIPLGGYSFTWSDKHENKMSKLDRFLVSQGTLGLFPNLIDSWNKGGVSAPSSMTLLKNKLKCLKQILKEWSSVKKSGKDHDRKVLHDSLVEIDVRRDKGESLPDDLSKRAAFFNDLKAIDQKDLIDLAQKAKVKWAIEGDETSNFFHEIVNKKRRHLVIKGILVDGEWIDNSTRVKTEFYTYFANIFLAPEWIRAPFEVIGKILANRLSLVIDDIISQEQSAFIRGRQIMDGPLILNELISSCKTRKEQSLLFKVDFQKAFDSIRRDHLDDILGKFGFGNKWRGGLRQGDPLSPFLFNLVMKSLHVSFQRLIDRGMFDPIFVGKDNVVLISHLFYADDAMFIGNNLTFTYLGVKVDANMMRVNSWNEKGFVINFSWELTWTIARSLRIRSFKSIHGTMVSLDNPISSSLSYCSNWLFNLELQKDASVALKLRKPNAALSFRRPPRSGDFSVKSAREEIDKHVLVVSSSPMRWSKVLPIKLNIFLCRMFLDRLPTRINISNRGLDIPCVLCRICEGGGLKPQAFFSFSCSMSLDLVRLLGRWWNIQIPNFVDPTS
ncbi:RNA-directed DNA polymerase, eukaryota [Tanacetum coccineum]